MRVDFDWGFKEGRQFGRGRSGGQVSCFLLFEKLFAGSSARSPFTTCSSDLSAVRAVCWFSTSSLFNCILLTGTSGSTLLHV